MNFVQLEWCPTLQIERWMLPPSLTLLHLQVQIKKIIRPGTRAKPCYEKENYDAYFLNFVQEKIMARAGCTVPFIPKEARKNSR